MVSPAQPAVQLQKPGAGLPAMEAWFARHLLMPVMSRVVSWERASSRFQEEGERILSLVDPLDPERMQTPVLIPRFTGIEDSSRFWSPAMAMEHLMIVGTGMTDIIVELSRGRVPPVEVDIAKVKPKAAYSPSEILPAFREFLETTQQKIRNEVKDRNSPSRLNHPWFGPITARQWHWLMGTHQGIHRRQIEKILQ